MLRVVQGDLTTQRVDAIVNAANPQLLHGGGVAAAIVRNGGSIIQSESDDWVDKYGPLGVGGAAITTAGSLPAHHVVHVVGPVYSSGQDNARLLSQAVVAALDAAAISGCKSVALPAISAGTFGYPRMKACAVIVSTCREWLDRRPGLLSEIRLVGFDEAAAEDFEKALAT